MREYDMPIEEQIKVLVREFHTLKESMETRFDSVDKRFDSIDAKLGNLDTKVATLDTRATTLDSKIDKVQLRIEDTRALLDQTRVLLEGTHATSKLGLEGVQGLRESTAEKFAAAAKTNAEQTDLLKSVLVHVRKRVDHLERPKRRRRT